jgi:prepilin-type N-terminal cleavage/methylation domain-containing protein
MQKGFTIIELIVVIAIIAVLAAIVLVNVQSYTKKSKEIATKAQLNQLASAVLKYYEETGSTSGFCGTNGANTCASISASDEFNKICKAILVSSGYTSMVCLDSSYSWCNGSSEKWVFRSSGTNIPNFCIDYLGNKKRAVSGTSCACSGTVSW